MSEDPLSIGVKKISEEGFKHLGSPVGSDAYIVDRITNQIEKVRKLLDKLPSLDNPHCEFVLL